MDSMEDPDCCLLANLLAKIQGTWLNYGSTLDCMVGCPAYLVLRRVRSTHCVLLLPYKNKTLQLLAGVDLAALAKVVDAPQGLEIGVMEACLLLVWICEVK